MKHSQSTARLWHAWVITSRQKSALNIHTSLAMIRKISNERAAMDATSWPRAGACNDSCNISLIKYIRAKEGDNMSEPRKRSPLGFECSFELSIIWMDFETVLNASNELPPRLAQSENRTARAARRGSIRELEEQQAHLDRVQESVSESDKSASEPPPHNTIRPSRGRCFRRVV